MDIQVPTILFFNPFKKSFVKETTYTTKKGKTIHRKAYTDSRKAKEFKASDKIKRPWTKNKTYNQVKDELHTNRKKLNEDITEARKHLGEIEDAKQSGETHTKRGIKVEHAHHVDRHHDNLMEKLDHVNNKIMLHDRHIEMEQQAREENRTPKKIPARLKQKGGTTKETLTIKTETKTGHKVELKADKYDVFMSIDIPKIGPTTAKVDRFKEENGKAAIFGKTRHKGKHFPFGLAVPMEDYMAVKKVADKNKEIDIDKAKNLKITGFDYAMGADAGNKYNIIYEKNNLPYEVMESRYASDRDILKKIEKLKLNTLGEQYGAKKIKSTHASYGGYHFNADQFKKLKKESENITEKKQKMIVNPEYAEYSRSELYRKEIEYDNIHNEGGEGYNPFRD